METPDGVDRLPIEESFDLAGEVSPIENQDSSGHS